jgi:hypothetical protein
MIDNETFILAPMCLFLGVIGSGSSFVLAGQGWVAFPLVLAAVASFGWAVLGYLIAKLPTQSAQ